jgi:hypothetical protein
MKHKHAELIKQWADGAEIEFNTGHGWNLARLDDFNNERWDFRIKPEEKQPVVRWLWAKQVIGGEWTISPVFRSKEEASKTFDGQVICLEYTRTEFPE